MGKMSSSVLGAQLGSPYSVWHTFSCRTDHLPAKPGSCGGNYGNFPVGIQDWSTSPPPAAELPIIAQRSPQTSAVLSANLWIHSVPGNAATAPGLNPHPEFLLLENVWTWSARL